MRFVLFLKALIALTTYVRAESDIPDDYPEDPSFKPLED